MPGIAPIPTTRESVVVDHEQRIKALEQRVEALEKLIKGEQTKNARLDKDQMHEIVNRSTHQFDAKTRDEIRRQLGNI